MKWFDQWFVRKCKWAWENKHLAYETEHPISSMHTKQVAVEEDAHSLNDGLRINIKKVIGGSVVTFRKYDRKIDRTEDRSYIITSEQDFNHELGKIITMESMR
jgi:hypothetical protein